MASKWRFAWAFFDLLRRNGHPIDRAIDAVIFALDRTSNAYSGNEGKLEVEWQSDGDGWEVRDQYDGLPNGTDRLIKPVGFHPPIARGSIRASILKLDARIRKEGLLADAAASLWLESSWEAMRLLSPSPELSPELVKANAAQIMANRHDGLSNLRRLGWTAPLSPIRFDQMGMIGGPK